MVDETATLSGLLRAHFDDGVNGLAIVEEQWPAYDHVKVQAVSTPGWPNPDANTNCSASPVTSTAASSDSASCSAVTRTQWAASIPETSPGPTCPADRGAVRACVRCGIYLVREGERRIALLLRGAEPHSMHQNVTL